MPRMRAGTFAVLSLACVLLPRSASAEEVAEATSRDCVWPAVGGAVGGLAVSWYGLAGIMALGGRSAYDIDDRPRNIALVLGLETGGLVGGTVLMCRLSEENRWFPTAASVLLGGVAGGAAGAAFAFWWAQDSGIDRSTDFPVRSVLLLLGATTVGMVGGGYGAFRLDRGIRGRPLAPEGTFVTIVPLFGDRPSVGIAAGSSF